MYDSFNRRINYLRISVTDRCNLRCTYCMPEEGIKLMSHNDILTYEEIFEVTKIAVGYGISKIRITGGEPLVRKGIVSLVGMISGLPEIEDLALTTNGILLDTHALPLQEAGLKRVNISLDTLDPERFRQLTRGGDIRDVFRGVQAAKDAGLKPIKVNCVVQRSRGEPDALAVSDFCREEGLEVRFIHQMHLSQGHFHVVEGGEGGNCRNCNRLRITADGKIKPCLFDDLYFDVKRLGAEEAIRQAIGLKPEKGTANNSGHFYNIGG